MARGSGSGSSSGCGTPFRGSGLSTEEGHEPVACGAPWVDGDRLAEDMHRSTGSHLRPDGCLQLPEEGTGRVVVDRGVLPGGFGEVSAVHDGFGEGRSQCLLAVHVPDGQLHELFHGAR